MGPHSRRALVVQLLINSQVYPFLQLTPTVNLKVHVASQHIQGKIEKQSFKITFDKHDKQENFIGLMWV